MDEIVLTQMIEVEDRHWWYLGRREVVRAALAHRGLQGAEILDMGCGGGGNTAMLAGFGRVRGAEMDGDARQVAQSRHLAEVVDGRLPDKIPFGDDRFDLITLLDVLEHVPDDAAAVRSLAGRLSPGGRVVLTVPAYMFLWRKQDELNQHQRRYTLGQLKALFTASGLEVEHATYYNVLLFPVIAAVILGSRLIGHERKDDNAIPAKPLNWLLQNILSLEKYFVPWLRVPFGASVLLIARRP